MGAPGVASAGPTEAQTVGSEAPDMPQVQKRLVGCAEGEVDSPVRAFSDSSDCGQESQEPVTIPSLMSGIFYCGDNLEILTELQLIPDESVDLIYLDPPFNSRRTYNVVYRGSTAQEVAFKDYWSWDEAAPTFARFVDSPHLPPRLRTFLRGLRDLLVDEDADLLAYVAMMSPRLVELHRVLKRTGTLYLHCDPTASHYLKLILDGILGSGNMRNEVIWQRTAAKGDARRKFGAVHDTLLAYGKSDEAFFSPVRTAPDSEYLGRFRLDDGDGRGPYRLAPLDSPNPRPNLTYDYKGFSPPKKGWRVSLPVMEQLDTEGRLAFPKSSTGRIARKHYLEEQGGPTATDVWTDIIPLQASSDEKTGYPTQKPLALLQRILQASSRPGDLVLDPFCGCGTTIEACERMGRRWIGIDIAAKAVEVTEGRFEKQGWAAPDVRWYPPDIDAAKALAARPSGGQKFEAWALRKIRAVRRRKHDRGIDGESFFRDAEGRVTHVLVSVKSGKLNPGMVRDLRGTMERERVPIGALVTLNEPSKEMRHEATHAGFLTVGGQQIQRLQFLTVEQIFKGERIRAPGVNVTDMQPAALPAAATLSEEQLSLRLDPAKPPSKVKRDRVEAAKPAPKSEPVSERPKRKSARPGR
jgi:site-specific DNA-methyltransferase (adenine-specific)